MFALNRWSWNPPKAVELFALSVASFIFILSVSLKQAGVVDEDYETQVLRSVEPCYIVILMTCSAGLLTTVVSAFREGLMSRCDLCVPCFRKTGHVAPSPL
jgi:hypothetical protein